MTIHKIVLMSETKHVGDVSDKHKLVTSVTQLVADRIVPAWGFMVIIMYMYATPVRVHAS